MSSHKSTPPASPAVWHYGLPAVLLHWTLALLIAFMVGLGWFMETVEREPGGRWYVDLHKSIGLIVFGLVVLRLLWRLFHRPEPLPAHVPRWQVRLAGLVQWLLYACMVLIPVSGILGASYSRAGLAFFGMALPRWTEPSRETARQLFEIHSALVWVAVALVVVHSAGGLWHLLARDQVFNRMWPSRR